MTGDAKRSDDVEAVLNFDPLDAVDRLTGDYRKNMDLGLAVTFLHVQNKRKVLSSADDTCMGSTTPSDFLRIARDEGFEVVLEDFFKGSEHDETFYVLWNPEGFLLRMETYGGKSVNSAEVYWQAVCSFKERNSVHMASSSAPDADGRVAFNKDVRDGLRYAMQKARTAGRVLPSWPKRDWLWLLNYMEPKTDGYDYKAITEARVSRLPEHVRKAIGPAREA